MMWDDAEVVDFEVFRYLEDEDEAAAVVVAVEEESAVEEEEEVIDADVRNNCSPLPLLVEGADDDDARSKGS